MKYVYGSLLLLSLIFAVDLAWAHYLDWRKEKRRQREMDRYAFSPFRGTKKFDDGELS